ncbi:type II secretion system protein GspG [Thermosediminibacter oceani]|uniref:N-terminal methylation n=1 Tax=Thermosediminibacter oceani (strain ATCC BAA-1034 / DSM 16646 / JW/IW-1228P) TaxID=555079 RepID=D9RZA2_THEOJ|nr:type II secretion system protein GspG [Thermosediminibacter oceani]ADL08656.1 N-terminal methylation [Thermosediminibacter oceani DSM 16646]
MMKCFRKKVKDQRGFTLVELLVVIAIIAILAAVVLPNAFNAIERSKVVAAEADYKSIKTAVLNFYADTGKWPQSDDYSYLVDKPDDNSYPGWNGPYLDRWPNKNPWGGTYTYKNDSAVNWDGQGSGDSARYLEVDYVPDNLYDRLRADLGGNMVMKDSQTSNVVYILISKD